MLENDQSTESTNDTSETPSIEDSVRAAFEQASSADSGVEEQTSVADVPDKAQVQEEKSAQTAKSKIDPKAAREAIFGKGKKQQRSNSKNETIAGTEQAQVEPIDILPPAPLNTQQKEVFHKLPPELKKGLSEIVTNLQGHATKVYQEYGRATKNAEGIVKAIEPYISHWNLKGIHEIPQALAQICAGQKFLDDNREDGVVRLASMMGLDRKVLAQKLLGIEGAQVNQQPQVDSALTKDIQDLKLWREQQQQQVSTYQQQQLQTLGRSIAAEVDQLRNQRDGQGRFLYPKLHDANYLRQIEPLVSRLQEINPEKPWVEHYRSAYYSTEGFSGANPSQNSATGLSSNGNDHIARAKAASVSLKGRGAAPNGGFDIKDLPTKTEDSVRLAYDMLMRH